eukprot:3738707-Rhodomonas_salina.2
MCTGAHRCTLMVYGTIKFGPEEVTQNVRKVAYNRSAKTAPERFCALQCNPPSCAGAEQNLHADRSKGCARAWQLKGRQTTDTWSWVNRAESTWGKARAVLWELAMSDGTH